MSGDAFREARIRLNQEIASAENSLAETNLRLQIDADQLRIALEAAENVGRLYRDADAATRRRYNQPLFKRIDILPEWKNLDRMTVRVVQAEPTEPYTTLLADSLVAEIEHEIRLIRAREPEGFPPEREKPTSGERLFSQQFAFLGAKPGTKPERVLRGVRSSNV